jgi:hypothetical protein
MIQNIYNIANEALRIKPIYVKINTEKIELLANDMIEIGVESFYEQDPNYKLNIKNEILKELVACSINYCYWYGASNLRPNGCSSSKMYECLELAFRDYKNFDDRINKLIELLSIKRFPLIEDRKRHLMELCEDWKAQRFIEYVINKKADLKLMCIYFPSFASDIFLKRASLFFIQMYRKFGWYSDLEVPVPADYQVPKILKHFGCIEYKPELEEMIYENQLIQKGSIQEIQIRAATIIVCQLLQGITGWTIGDVDSFLWTRRKEVDEPFHLTITTDY